MYTNKEILMGIDAGTGGVRVGLYDVNGNEVVFATSDYKTYHEHPGWAEQDPDDWWNCLVKATRKALEKANVDKKQIIGISLDTTACSVVLCMNDGSLLRRSVIWMDVRASEEAAFISSTKDDVLKYNGYGNASAEWMPCKALWLKKHEPENYYKAEKVCEFTDWFMHKLTGRWTANINNTSMKWYYNRDDGGWPVKFYERIGLKDVLDKFPQEIYDLGVKVGGLTGWAADELGLMEGTPVGQGGIDALVGMIGLGVVKPGRVALITGSSHLIFSLTEKTIHARGLFGTYPDAVVPGSKVIEGGQISTGSIINWFKNNFCRDLEVEAVSKGVSVYDLLNGEAEKIPIGSEGLMLLDFWQGNRTPYTDPDVRGLIYGFSLNHSRAHLYRAIMEGIAYGTENILEQFRANGFSPEEIYICGGATSSDLFMQIHSDVSNIPINVPEQVQAPSLGAAMLASVAAGVYKSIEEAAENMVRYTRRIEPNYENHQKYRRYFQQYKKAYPQLADWMRNTSALAL